MITDAEIESVVTNKISVLNCDICGDREFFEQVKGFHYTNIGGLNGFPPKNSKFSKVEFHSIRNQKIVQVHICFDCIMSKLSIVFRDYVDFSPLFDKVNDKEN